MRETAEQQQQQQQGGVVRNEADLAAAAALDSDAVASESERHYVTNNGRAPLLYDVAEALRHYDELARRECALGVDLVRNFPYHDQQLASNHAHRPNRSPRGRSRPQSREEQELQRQQRRQQQEQQEWETAARRRRVKAEKIARSKTLSPQMRHLYVQAQLSALPSHDPWFIRIVCMLLIFFTTVLIAVALSAHEMAPFRLSSATELCSMSAPLTSSDHCPLGFQCSTICFDTEATRRKEVNPWLGPTKSLLLRAGAKFSPCMRPDTDIQRRLRQQREVAECGANGVVCESSEPFPGMSCCRVDNSSFGMTSRATCDAFSGDWLLSQGKQTLCSELFNIVLRPCCLGEVGRCELYTESQCAFYGGRFHSDAQLCSQVGQNLFVYSVNFVVFHLFVSVVL